ncbi:helix-turn-helix domain-containing protein [Riemerella anatipestifer]|uniref:Helix-turn-helix domain-containing protein n=1 Tax=Riemerella anatipestifer TaxID=34085 RepID=A0AAP3AMM7_RIEAN|nr:helix-turn-helix domain-containing protein [Riemerella anatipestifer]AZZ57899.1 XRE family transcriptional regulator [Riemerella anatipestifer]MBT0572003.1 helix-turn-helix transcriptional regulator [Riemerella anatipestifer]MCO7318444.1 helix-turn-helix domain-containing protein [Riemerella anatipestifer]MCQ4154773.1 helix-turn-helix domain-containing protein [Riemerella anatipestifer]MCQ4180736.1 helix-turn-helix domain-containing protein [Riemerella anatipestifer]
MNERKIDKAVFQKFKDEVEKLKKEKKMKKSDIAQALGYEKYQTFSNILQGITKLSLEDLLNFCDIFGYDISYFMNNSNEKEKHIEMMNINTIKTRMKNIEQQIDVVSKTNDMMKQLYISGITLAESQISNLRNLRALIGH